jgi:hypothetical protein
MPKSLYLLTLCLCFGCVTVQSTQKQLNSGNYDEAITNALKELRPTITFCPDAKGYINCSGNSGLATAGSGDVLTGIIGSLLAQGYPPKTAAVLGVYIHGRAAYNFVKRYPKTLLTAALLPDLLAPVIHALEQDNMS